MGGQLAAIAALGLIALASRQIGGQFRRMGLPLISGFLLCGVLAGPDALGLLSRASVERLRFVDQVAIAFIGFIAGSELYLREFRDRIRPILRVTSGIIVFVTPAVAFAFYVSADSLPRLADAGAGIALGAALIAGSILPAISPSSTIAIIKELRAWGPFTRLALGVTVIMDAIVIVLFAISVELADALAHGSGARIGTAAFVLVDLLASAVTGVALGYVVLLILKLTGGRQASFALLLLGWSVFAAADVLRAAHVTVAGFELLLEPLLICMVAGLFVTNATSQRNRFDRLLDRTSPVIFVVFFTLAGASLSLDVLSRTWQLALLLFGVRLAAIIVGAFLGGWLADEPPRESSLLWMSFVTQAGVGLGLAKEVALEFPGWGEEVATVIIAVIVLNQLVGPPLFRWVLKATREAHPRADAAGFDGVRDAIIFGQEGQAMALAHQLHDHGWNVKLAALDDVQFEEPGERGLEICPVDGIELDTLERLDATRAECIVSMLDDDRNYRVCELAYENYGTDNLVVRAEKPRDLQRFADLGVLVVDPATAMINLLDHLVRSPLSASLLLGLEEGRDSYDIQVGNPNLHGVRLRDLTLPEDALVLSLRRGTGTLITHGGTRLRLNDWVTVVGSESSLDEVVVRFEGEARDRQKVRGEAAT